MGVADSPQEPRGLHTDLCDTAPEHGAPGPPHSRAPTLTYFWEGGPCRLAGLPEPSPLRS